MVYCLFQFLLTDHSNCMGFVFRWFGLQTKNFLTTFLILLYFPYSSNPRTNQVFGNFYLLSLYQTMRNRSFFYCLPYSSFLFCNRVCPNCEGKDKMFFLKPWVVKVLKISKVIKGIERRNATRNRLVITRDES